MTRTRQELVTLHEVVSACASGGCRQRKRLRALLWKSSGRHFADLCAGGREVARAAQAQGFTVQAWDATFDATRLNLCRSAVRARLKHDIKLANFRLFVLHRQVERLRFEPRGLLCAYFLSVQNTKFRQLLVQPCACFLWQSPTCQSMKVCCGLRVTPKCILTCASLDTKCDDPLLSC